MNYVRRAMAALALVTLPACGQLADDDPKVVAFREQVRELSEQLGGTPCTLAEGTSNDEIFRPSRAEFENLRRRVATTAYAGQFARAEAEARQKVKAFMKFTTFECVDPRPATDVRAEILRSTREQAARIATAAGL